MVPASSLGLLGSSSSGLKSASKQRLPAPANFKLPPAWPSPDFSTWNLLCHHAKHMEGSEYHYIVYELVTQARRGVLCA